MNTEQAIEEQLRSGERCELTLVGSRTVDMAAASGILCLTDQRLLFVPRGLNFRGRSPWFIDRGSISAIEIARRTWQPYNGGLRRRLLIRCTDGSEQFFVLNHVDAVAADFRARLSL